MLEPWPPNPPTFYGSKIEKSPQELIDEINKIINLMGLTTSKKAELATYQLNNVSQTWYVQWRDNMPLRGGHVT